MNKSRRGFTLLELLIVAIVLGILAGVAVPKYTRVLETRRVSEAEEILSALRTEQEQRCVMGKQYQMDPQQLVLLKNTGTNFSYVLEPGGASAVREGKDYQIKMLSYKTGELCCEGDDCDLLNKDYPPCGEAPEDECMNQPKPVDPCEENPNQESCCFAPKVWKDGVCRELTDCEKDPDDCKCNPKQAKCCTGNQVWNPVTQKCEGCPRPPEECPDGFFNEHCVCVKCLAELGVRMNAAKNGCECAFSKEKCHDSGKVFMDDSYYYASRKTYPRRYCRDCSDSNLKVNAQTNKCECSLTTADCAKNGLVLVTNKSYANTGDRVCKCRPCEEFNNNPMGFHHIGDYTGKSSDGTIQGCEHLKGKCTDADRERCQAEGKVATEVNVGLKDHRCECRVPERGGGTWCSGLNAAACGAQGKVFNYYYCRCQSCSDYGKSGTTSTGLANDCKCDGSTSESICGSQGKVFDAVSCACKPCSSFGIGYGGTTPTGKLSDCSDCPE